MGAPRKEHLIPENTWVPFLILDIYVALHHVRQVQYLYKFIKPKQYSCSCATCKLLSLFEARGGTGLTSSRSHVERKKS